MPLPFSANITHFKQQNQPSDCVVSQVNAETPLQKGLVERNLRCILNVLAAGVQKPPFCVSQFVVVLYLVSHAYVCHGLWLKVGTHIHSARHVSRPSVGAGTARLREATHVRTQPERINLTTEVKVERLVDNVIAESRRPFSWCIALLYFPPSVLPRADVDERKTSLERVPISKISNSRGANQKYKLNCNGKAMMYRANHVMPRGLP
ncbi:hypothetical protein J6590_025648 [Homalodisca vitripennis]|nr:hypothetical protein J6590_025648 [Homalodisca vitripennis]